MPFVLTARRISPILVSCLLVAVLLTFAPQARGAKSSGGSIGLGLNGTYLLTEEKTHANAMGASGAFSLLLTKNLALELSAGYQRGDTRGNPSGLSKGRLSQFPLQLTLAVRVPFGQFPLVPYLALGGGYILNSFALDEEMVAGYEDLGYTITEKIKNSVFFAPGAGVEVLVVPGLTIDVQFRFRLCKAGGTWSVEDELSGYSLDGTMDDINLNAYVLGLSLRYFF